MLDLNKKVTEISHLEMIPCPKCGKPFPLKRKQLGYNCCVNCSAEKKYVAIVEGIGTEEEPMEAVRIVPREEGISILRQTHKLAVSRSIDWSRTAASEDRDKVEIEGDVDTKPINLFEADENLKELEKEFTGENQNLDLFEDMCEDENGDWIEKDFDPDEVKESDFENLVEEDY